MRMSTSRDYCCFIHSKEGEFATENHKTCEYLENVGEFRYAKRAPKDRESKILASDDVCRTHLCHSNGFPKAYILVFILPGTTIDYENGDLMLTSIALFRLKDGNYYSPQWIEDRYNWYTSEFDNCKGYSTNPKSSFGVEQFEYSIWECSKDKWAINICPLCYKLLFCKSKDNLYCSSYLRSIAEKHNIKCDGVVLKSELITRIKAYFLYLYRVDKVIEHLRKD